MRDTGLPPKSPDEYKIDMPAPLKEAGIELDQTSTKAFQAKAHALGLTQKQYEGVMAEFFQQIPNIADNATNYGSAKLKTELLAHYKTPEAVQENISLAFKVVRAYGDEKEVEALMGAAGNAHPAWLRIMAKVGKELGEDTAVNPEEVLGGDSLEHLMRGSYGKEDSPYWNKEDPRHAATVQKVTAYHERQSQAAQRRRGA